MKLEDLTPEQVEKIKACETPEEAIALAMSEGVELTREQLDSFSGGGEWIGSIQVTCPYCGNTWKADKDSTSSTYLCSRCYKTFELTA